MKKIPRTCAHCGRHYMVYLKNLKPGTKFCSHSCCASATNMARRTYIHKIRRSLDSDAR